MTSDELERIKSAYYSGLQVQIWFDGIWYNYDDRENNGFSERRQYRIVGSEYSKIAEEKIKNLEKEIAELKKDWYYKVYFRPCVGQLLSNQDVEGVFDKRNLIFKTKDTNYVWTIKSVVEYAVIEEITEEEYLSFLNDKELNI